MDKDIVLKSETEKYGLSSAEYDLFRSKLHRLPNELEIRLAASLWSEHCSYKSSKLFLKRFPTTGKNVLFGPGENAGVVAVSDKYAVVFKMESHNHPSFIEPYQGAATGVGGILRDIFTMGARPVLTLDAIWFGSPKDKKTAYLIDGVVRGIGDYGNCMGIPTVGGQTRFASCYNGNNLVNAFSLGIVRRDEIFTGNAPAGDSVIYVGSKTGLDGLGGAAMASAIFDKSSDAKRPTVQVGDPFTEKLLLEACLELFKTKAVSGMQDMGAAGLASSSFEMAERSSTGMMLDLNKVPLRQKLSASEIMLSESQERMLVIVKKGQEGTVFDIFRKWQLDAVKIGEVIEKPVIILNKSGSTFELNVELFSNAKLCKKKIEPIEIQHTIILNDKIDTKKTILKMIADPNIADKSWVTAQYDQSIGTDTIYVGHGAPLLRVKDDDFAISATVVGKSNMVEANARYGAERTMLEAACNLAVAGATPIAVTDCLNFGSPDNSNILYSFSESIEGISIAADRLNTPIVSGNVSFYNETEGKPIWPTPVIGMVGIRKPMAKPEYTVTESDSLYVVGDMNGILSFSGYGWLIKNDVYYNLPEKALINWEKSIRTIKTIISMTKDSKLSYVDDVSLGGIAIGAVKAAIRFNIGFNLELPDKFSNPSFLFSEPPTLFLVVTDDKTCNHFNANGISCNKIGIFGGKRIKINNLDTTVSGITKLFKNGFTKNIGIR